MKLSNEQIKQLQQSLDKYASKCAQCGGSFSLSDEVFQLSSYQTGTLYVIPPPGPIFPIVCLVCDKCGHTILFSALALNVVPRPGDKSNGQKH